MKLTKETIRTYCPRCNKHQVFSISIYKKGRERALSAGRRRYEEKQKGYGGQKKPIQRKLVKTTKKIVLKLKCKACGFIQLRNLGRLSEVKLERK